MGVGFGQVEDVPEAVVGVSAGTADVVVSALVDFLGDGGRAGAVFAGGC